jgi:glycolate oxidase iron-sulfur subunit
VQTSFTLTQLLDPQVASSEKILRACVHCGFCTATCPTYVLLGDELDSPRGRIYLIKEMLEQDKPPTRDVVKHIDRCLSCLACMTTCPVGRALHASGGPCPRTDREILQASFDRARVARIARARADRIPLFSVSPSWRGW